MTDGEIEHLFRKIKEMQDENLIEPGCIVMLKSGGPKMTVACKSSSGLFWCCDWFEGSELMSGLFVSEQLNVVQEA